MKPANQHMIKQDSGHFLGFIYRNSNLYIMEISIIILSIKKD